MMSYVNYISVEKLTGFLSGAEAKNMPANAGDVRDVGLIPGLERSPGERNGNPLQYSCPRKSHRQRSLAGYSPWGRKESHTTEVSKVMAIHHT